jgi:predicted transcriptional regulator
MTMNLRSSSAKGHIGTTLREDVRRGADAWKRAECGEHVREDNVSFENWQALFNVLTPKRYELLRHVHHHPEQSIRALARALGRDYKRVHEDVKALSEAGLLEQDGNGIRADYEAIELPMTRIAL